MRLVPKRVRIVSAALVLVASGAWLGARQQPASAANGARLLANYQNIPLWEAGQVPLAQGNGPLDSPFLTAFLPEPSRRNGGAVIIAPGGANIMLMYGGEGFEVAERFNDRMTGFRAVREP